MTPEEFRQRGHQTVDWVADYMVRIGEFPVKAPVEPGDIRGMLPAEAPEQGEDFADVLADLDRIILPGITHWQAPGFFAYFPANASGPAALADLVSSGFGAQGMLWDTGPAVTELEQHVLEWLAVEMDLPEKFRGNGVIQDSASSSTLCAILAARHRAGGIDALSNLVAYTSEQAHSSIAKGLRVAGIPDERTRSISTTPDFAMRADHLAYEIVNDQKSGLTPFFVAATVGTTSTTGIDPVTEVGWVANNFNAWLHVDAAFAGAAALCPEMRFLNVGLETPTATSSTPTNGCSPTSTARPSMWPIGPASTRRCPSPRSICATRPASRERWWTTATGKCLWGGGSELSSCGSCFATTAWKDCGPTSAVTSPGPPSSLSGWRPTTDSSWPLPLWSVWCASATSTATTPPNRFWTRSTNPDGPTSPQPPSTASSYFGWPSAALKPSANTSKNSGISSNWPLDFSPVLNGV